MKTSLLLSLVILLESCSPVLPIDNPFQAEDPLRTSSTEVPSSALRIIALDVGQGDATLVIGPSGKAMLIDAGRPEGGIGAVLPELERYGVDRLHWIVATHYDADHIGGIAEVMKGRDQALGTEDDFVPAEAVVDRGDFTDKDTFLYNQYVEIATPYRQEAEPGMIFELGDGARAEVVVVNGRYADGRSIPLNPDEENEASIGFLIAYGNFRYFTAGDLTGGGAPGGYETKDMETTAGEIVGDVDILHIGHHGSSSSTNETFLEEIKPEAAVISVGEDNDYGHPTGIVLNRLENIGAQVYRTDQMGDLLITSNGETYDIEASH